MPLFTRLLALVRTIERLRMHWIVIGFALHYALFRAIILGYEGADAPIRDAINFFYFWSTTLTTIGYGDVAPLSPMTRLCTPFFQVSGIMLMTAFITKLAEMLISRASRKRRGLMPTTHKDHILILGSYSTRVPELLRQIFAGEDNGNERPVVCAFTDLTETPFDAANPLWKLRRYVPVFLRADFLAPQTFMDAGLACAHTVYILGKDDAQAVEIVSALSHQEVSATVVAIMEDERTLRILPCVPYKLQAVAPLTVALAVKIGQDESAAAFIKDLSDNCNGSHNIFTTHYRLSEPTCYREVKNTLEEHGVVPVAIVLPDGTTIIAPKPDSVVECGMMINYLTSTGRLDDLFDEDSDKK